MRRAAAQGGRARSLLDWGEDRYEREDGEGAATASAVAGTQGTGCTVNTARGPRYHRRCVELTVSQRGTTARVVLAYSVRRVGARAVMEGALLVPGVAADVYVALGVNPGSRQTMAGANTLLAYVDKSAAGASIADYYMGSHSWRDFSPSSNFIFNRTATLSAGKVGTALAATFGIILPSASATTQKLMLAMGYTSSGQPQQHFAKPVITVASTPDAGTVSAAAVAAAKVLNPVKYPPPPKAKPPPPLKRKPSPPPPKKTPSPSPAKPLPKSSPAPVPSPVPSPSPSPACALPVGGNQTLAYAQCFKDTDQEGAALALYVTVSGGTLKIGMKAKLTDNWMGWSWGSDYGGMVGSNAVFAYPCTTCASGAAASAAKMTSFFSEDFTAATVTIAQKQAALLPSGELALAFETPWPGGSSMTFRFGRGLYLDGMPGLQVLGPHGFHPRMGSLASSGAVTFL